MATATRGRLGRGDNIAALMTAYCTPESAFHQSPDLIPLLERAAQAFVDAQNPSGLLDAGNLDSPPDTAFTVDALACSLDLARRAGPNDPRLASVKETLTRFLRRVGDALVTGGIHTPNHRWVVCSALARIHALFPAQKYVDRIDDWLGEGIYQDADGLFPERSPNYARVEVASLLTMARLLNRPALLEPTRRHLTANLYLLHPDGEIETVNSRRQDQDRPLHVANFYVQYRYMAIRDNNPVYAAVARLIAARSGEGLVEGVNPVIQFLEEPLLRRPLPAVGAPIPSNYSRVFANSKLVRIRRDTRSASIYGGGDTPLVIASGIAHNPTYFKFRSGRAILDSVRMGSPQFFSLGTFRPESVKIENNGAAVHLHQRFEAPYYQPLPKEHRRADGDYPLTPAKDGRFWSKLDFPHRKQSGVQVLDQKVTILEKDGGSFELQIEITGSHDRVPYTIELAFRPGGEFTGSGLHAADQVQFLKEGKAVYRNGPDAIEFGPGQADHQATNISGHLYQAHNGTLRAAGNRVYITGYTPFRKILTIRAV